MNDRILGRTLRALRHRRGWRQADLAVAAGVSRSVVSHLEAGVLDPHALGALRSAIEAAGGTLRLSVSVPGGDLERLLDADHAVVQSWWLTTLAGFGWDVTPEVTFSVYGERGSIDVLGWHPAAQLLLVVEVKTVIVDAGELVSTLDRKVRLGRVIARERGWRPREIVPALIVLEGRTARRRVAEHAALFARFTVRGRAAVTWLRSPMSPCPTGLLIVTKVPDAHRGDRRRAGRQRVRPGSGHPRSARAEGQPDRAADRA